MRMRTLSTVVAALSFSSLASAQSIGGSQDRVLDVGDAAPKLSVNHFVKGDEIKDLQKGHVYVVEFWATWCAPCRKSIPHLSELQEEYRDEVTIIGVSDEELKVVRPFVSRMGSEMNYTVAVDSDDRMGRQWMKAAKQDGIPCAFIIDRELRIAFIGHPLSQSFETVLSLVVQGRYDPVLNKKAAPYFSAYEKHKAFKDWRMAMSLLDQIIEMDRHVFANVAVQKFQTMLLEMGDAARAMEYARADLVPNYMGDAETLARLARLMLENAEVRKKEPKLVPFALEVATMCKAVARPDDPEAFSVLALAQYHNGQVQDAVENQSQAYFLASPKKKARHKEALDMYQQHSSRGG
jgi:thiol-disulfide isomerase/thioredoxin